MHQPGQLQGLLESRAGTYILRSAAHADWVRSAIPLPLMEDWRWTHLFSLTAIDCLSPDGGDRCVSSARA